MLWAVADRTPRSAHRDWPEVGSSIVQITITVSVERSDGALWRDLELTFDDQESANSLLEIIKTKLPDIGEDQALLHVRLDEVMHSATPLADYYLRSGERLRVVTPDHPIPQLRRASWAMSVMSGQYEGWTVPLSDTPVLVGRDPEAVEFVLEDDSISRRHCRLQASDQGVVVEDLDSTNGVEVGGVLIEGPVVLRDGDRFRLGETEVAVFRPRRAGPPPHIAYEAGRLAVNRPPRVVVDPPESVHRIPAPPATPSKRRLPLAAALVPAVLGGVMFFVMRAMGYDNFLYLIFMAAAPVMALTTWVSDRRSGRAEFRAKSKKWRQHLSALLDKAREERSAAHVWLADQFPDVHLLGRRVEGLSPRLWDRSPSHPDFCDLRVGVADLPARVRLEVGGGGDEELTLHALGAAEDFEMDRAVPVVVQLRRNGAVGVVRSRSEYSALAHWWVIQLAAHHSPRDLAIAIMAPGQLASWEWTKWLPHKYEPAGVPGVALDDQSTVVLFDHLKDLVMQRARESERTIAGSVQPFSPHLVLIVCPPIRLPSAEVSALLDRCPQLGISVIWFAEETVALPSQCRVVIETTRGETTVLYTSGGARLSGVASDSIEFDRVRDLARLLSPLDDATTDAGRLGIPDRVDLLELLGIDEPKPAEIVAMWRGAPASLRAVIGADSDGVVSIDLAEDGPHALVAGTTGAGKSELLQTWLASLALTLPPTRVNFVLIDYKGGSAFKDCVGLPHSVGFVTDLDERLAERALASLNAELKHRERVVASANAKDMEEMRSRDPEATPPSLVLVVDEFAALKAEVPDFVDGLVDIARRGRSLGVHMVLATQKPRGVISADIQANTNLRIALRVVEASESQDVINRSDAASIPTRARGRAFIKSGPADAKEVQIGYVGGSGHSVETVGPPAKTFSFSRDTLASQLDPQADSVNSSHLTEIVDAVIEAARSLGIREQRRPWLPPLPEVVPLASIATAPDIPPDVVLGLVDDAAQQSQPPFVLDLVRSGSIAVFGTSGSGKTTLLRTLAASLAMAYSTDEVHLYGIDAGGRALTPISRLQHCGDVVYREETDRLRRLVSMLGSTVDQRRRSMAEVGVATVSELRTATGSKVPSVVVLIDGFKNLWETLEGLDRGAHYARLLGLIAEGGSAGLHFVLTADRRSALPAALGGAISRRILLRLATEDEYNGLGMRPPANFGKAPPGRGWADGKEIQVAVLGVGERSDGAAQTEAIAQLGEAMRDTGADVPAVRLLPNIVVLGSLPPATESQIKLGMAESDFSTVGLDFVKYPSLMVVGPTGSGRSTALATIVGGALETRPETEAFLVAPRRSPLIDAQRWSGLARSASEVEDLCRRILERIGNQARAVPVLVVVDDGDQLTEGRPAAALEQVAAAARDANDIMLAAMSTHRATRAYAGWAQFMRFQGSGLILQPRDDTDGDVFQLSLPRRSDAAMPPGRGYLCQGNAVQLIQVAIAEF